MEVGLGPGDFVLDGDPAPPPQKGLSPNCCGKTVHVRYLISWWVSCRPTK